MDDVTVIVLAAGKGSRMRSHKAKVLHALGGKPLVHHVLDACMGAGIRDIVLVVGHEHEAVRGAVRAYPVRCVLQPEQKGTGHAVGVTEAEVHRSTVIVLCGDAPFVRSEMLHELIRLHRRQENVCTVLAAHIRDPNGYGRLVTGMSGALKRIVEHKDASPKEREITLVNSGIYAFARDMLFTELKKIQPTNTQGEYYLTDVIAQFTQWQLPVGVMVTTDARSVLGVNTVEQLEEAEKLLNSKSTPI